jgi:acyl-Coa thioesterase superfamily protein/acyl-CoA thioesterase superfamily protein
MGPAAFSAVTGLVAHGGDRFTGEVHPDWSIAGKPNGGYLLALLGRAAVAASPHPHPIAASAHYLHSPEPGPVDVRVEVLRAGRSASQLRVRMVQAERACIEALFTMSELDPDGKPYWTGGLPEPGTDAFDDCVRVPGVTPTGVPAPIMEQVDLRIEKRSLGFAAGRPSGRGELYGWLALPQEEEFDALSLIYAVDAFPPATFEVEVSGWVPTLELSVYVRAWPAPGPVRVLHKAHLIDAQRVDESCWVWDSEGRLVAQGTQLAGIRLG